MKRAAVLAVAVLSLTACASQAKLPKAATPTPSATFLPLPATEAPVATGAPSASSTVAATTTAPASSAPSATATATPSAAPLPTKPVETPMKLGIIAADRATFEKLLNTHGLLGGRTVTPSWVASCDKLTGVDFALVQGETCSGKPFPVIAAGPAIGDLSATITSVTSLSIDDRVRNVLTHALAPKAGALGVVVESCAVNAAAVSKTLTPLAKQKGYTVAATSSVPCGKAADGGKAVGALQAAKVKQVIFVSGANEATLVRAFTKQAKAKAFAPVYGVTSAVVAATLTEQRDRIVGVGWLPSLDTTAATGSAEINDCLRAVRKAGAAAPKTPAERFGTYGACDLLSFADRVLRLTRGSTDATAVRNAVKSTGRLFKAASVLASATDFRTRQTGPATGSAFAWSTKCSCYQYASNQFTL